MRSLAFVIVIVTACAFREDPLPRILPADAGALDGPICTCNPLTHGGCNSDEKCTWITEVGALGHIGCAPIGVVNEGGRCSYGRYNQFGFDNCRKGDVCLDGTCRTICDHNGGEPVCAIGFACSTTTLFAYGVTHVAGACVPDP
ncbi:MAG: hypothetical protein H0T46_28080 [Deltaproteobacteria bacterium]|nr:hypothetical protein [Deltaproteobacteria bacterium]